MRQDEEEPASENRTVVWITPLVCLDELENKIHVQTLFELNFELFLDFTNDANQIE